MGESLSPSRSFVNWLIAAPSPMVLPEFIRCRIGFITASIDGEDTIQILEPTTESTTK